MKGHLENSGLIVKVRARKINRFWPKSPKNYPSGEKIRVKKIPVALLTPYLGERRIYLQTPGSLEYLSP
jgi:hypothetical protein